MRFWIFMMLMTLQIPLAMIGFGKYFMKTSPKKINFIFGYRTNMSMKNKETWDFAHRYAGKIWYVTGWVTLLISLVAMLIVKNQDTDTISLLGGLLCLLQIIPLLLVIYPTEKALRRNFDNDGNRK